MKGDRLNNILLVILTAVVTVVGTGGWNTIYHIRQDFAAADKNNSVEHQKIISSMEALDSRFTTVYDKEISQNTKRSTQNSTDILLLKTKIK